MPRSPLTLAALATVAVPGFDAYDAFPVAHTGGDVDAAVVLDAAGRRWVVRAPRSAAAGAALEAEVALLGALVDHVDAGRLPFDVPRPAGFAHLPEGGRAVVHPQLRGRPLRMERLGPGPGLAAELGRAIAALHELPPATVEDAGLPVYDAEAYRRRRMSEVDEAAGTGRVPAGLLRRWERALEDVAVWRFQPTVVHGDLSADHVLCSADAPTGILGWSEAKVADPADDLAWLLVAAPQEAVDPILEAYSLRRTELSDRHLADRALLAGELALARWLLHGVRVDDPEIVDDATAMLVELDEQTAAAEESAAPVAGGFAGEHDDVHALVHDTAPDDDALPEDALPDDTAPDDALLAEDAGTRLHGEDAGDADPRPAADARSEDDAAAEVDAPAGATVRVREESDGVEHQGDDEEQSASRPDGGGTR